MVREYCDRCGAEMPSKPHRYRIRFGSPFCILIRDLTPWSKEYSICHDCRVSFYDWLLNGR